MSIFVAIGFLFVLVALAAAGFFMLRSPAQDATQEPGTDEQAAAQATARTGRMAKALTVRIAVSVVLFICVLIGWKLGYIKPSGLPVQGVSSK